MSEHHDDLAQHPAAYRDSVQALADQLIEILKDHERRDHDGERCPLETVNVLAYLGFRAGLQPEPAALEHMGRRIRDYSARYAEHTTTGGAT